MKDEDDIVPDDLIVSSCCSPCVALWLCNVDQSVVGYKTVDALSPSLASHAPNPKGAWLAIL